MAVHLLDDPRCFCPGCLTGAGHCNYCFKLLWQCLGLPVVWGAIHKYVNADAEITISGASGTFGPAPPYDSCDATMADLNHTFVIPGPFPITACIDGSATVLVSHCKREISFHDGSIAFLPYDRHVNISFSIGCAADFFAGPVTCRTRVTVSISDIGFPGGVILPFETPEYPDRCEDLCTGVALAPLIYIPPEPPPFSVSIAFV